MKTFREWIERLCRCPACNEHIHPGHVGWNHLKEWIELERCGKEHVGIQEFLDCKKCFEEFEVERAQREMEA